MKEQSGEEHELNKLSYKLTSSREQSAPIFGPTLIEAWSEQQAPPTFYGGNLKIYARHSADYHSSAVLAHAVSLMHAWCNWPWFTDETGN